MGRGRVSRRIDGVGAVAACLLLTACVGKTDATGAGPIAAIAVSNVDLTLPWPGFADAEVELTPRRELPFESDMPTLFVHLSGADGRLVRTFDRALREEWVPGETQAVGTRLYQSALAAPLPAGDYALTAGLYDPALGRYELTSSLPEAGRRELRLGTVRVPASTGGESIAFSPGWLPAEKGWDIQVLARRRLRGFEEAGLLLSGIDGPAEMWVRMGLAASPGEWADIERRAEDTSGWVRVSGPCIASPVEVALDREMSFSLDLHPAPEGRCELAFESNVVAVQSVTGAAPGPSLDVLSWRRRPAG